LPDDFVAEFIFFSDFEKTELPTEMMVEAEEYFFSESKLVDEADRL